MKIALITDTHFGVRGDNLAFQKHFETFYKKLFFPYLQKNNIKTIIHLGDVVDCRRYITYTALNKMKEQFFKPCLENDIDVHIIIGNHDTPYKNTNELNSISEIFGDDFPNIRYYDSYSELEFDGQKISLVPWINKSNYKETMEAVDKTTAKICLGHFEFSGFGMYLGLINKHGMDPKLFEKYDLVCSGHFHHKNTIGNITYLGSPYEMTWHDFNDRRGFHILDTETGELEYIQNPYRIFYKIYYDDEKKDYEDVDLSIYQDCFVKLITRNKTNQNMYEDFVDRLYKINPADLKFDDDISIEDTQSSEEILKEAEDTIDSIKNSISNIETNVDKQELEKLLIEIYLEALNMEK